MFNVIIVDDEIAAREGLKNYIEDSIESFEVCGEFTNGEDAIQFIKKNPDTVDVVLTDIKMTTVSGVLLAQMLRELQIDTTIVLSSHIKEYEYIKLAIKYNAISYLEKPIDYNELDEVFEKIKKQLKTKRKVVNDAAADKQYLLTLQFLIEVYSGFFNGYEQLLNRAKTFGLGEFATKRPCAKFTVEIEKEETEWKYGSEGRELAIQNAFRTKGIAIYNIFSTRNSMDLLAVPDDMMHQYKGERFKEKINYILHDAVSVLKVMGIKAKISGVGYFDYLVDLNFAHRDFVQQIKIEKFIDALSVELLSGNFTSETKQKIEQILSDFSLENYKIDLNAFYGGTNEKHSPVSFKEKSDIENSAIKKSLEWINSNYNWNITLNDAAKEVMLSPVYYGRLFKKNVGVSFTAYVLDFRLNKARHLLKDSMLNVREIANLVGYKDVNYFIRLFKKKYGVSPNEFKKQW